MYNINIYIYIYIYDEHIAYISYLLSPISEPNRRIVAWGVPPSSYLNYFNLIPTCSRIELPEPDLTLNHALTTPV